jgi:hypothetical protein
MLKRMKRQISVSSPENFNPFYRILAFAVASPPARPTAEPRARRPSTPADPSPPAGQALPAPAPSASTARNRASGENDRVNLARVAWLLTVIGCLVAVVVLALNGYLGYAGVTLAVALSAAINLT